MLQPPWKTVWHFFKNLQVGLSHNTGFPGGSAGKESACNVGDLSLIPGLGRSPGKKKVIPTPVFWPGEFPGLYNSWGLKELVMTEWLSLHHITQEFLSRCLPKRIENVCPYKSLDMNIHRRIICNSLKLATTQMSINWLVDKHNIICPYKWYYSAIKRNV